MKVPEEIAVVIQQGQLDSDHHGEWVESCLSIGHDGHIDASGLINAFLISEEVAQSFLAFLEILSRFSGVYSLSLKNNNLSRIMPEVLTHLAKMRLTRLDMSGCQIMQLDFFPKLASSCPALRYLDLQGNDFGTGDVGSMEDWHVDQEICEDLEFKHEQMIRGLSHLGCLKYLEQLNLSKTNIHSLGKNLAVLVGHLVQKSRLKKLELAGMGISNKILANILVASALVQAKGRREIEIFVGLKGGKNSFMPKLSRWNLIRRKECAKAKRGWLGLFSALERSRVLSRGQLSWENCNWNVLLGASRSRMLSLINKEVLRLWPDGKQSAIAMDKFQKRKSSDLRGERVAKRLRSQNQARDSEFSFTPTVEGGLALGDDAFGGDITGSVQGQSLFELTGEQMQTEGELTMEVNQYEQNMGELGREYQWLNSNILSLPIEIRLRIAEYSHQSYYSVKLS